MPLRELGHGADLVQTQGFYHRIAASDHRSFNSWRFALTLGV